MPVSPGLRMAFRTLVYEPLHFNSERKRLNVLIETLRVPPGERNDIALQQSVARLQGCELFRCLEDVSAQKELVRTAILQQFEAGDIIFSRNSLPENVAVILSGEVAIRAVDNFLPPDSQKGSDLWDIITPQNNESSFDRQSSLIGVSPFDEEMGWPLETVADVPETEPHETKRVNKTVSADDGGNGKQKLLRGLIDSSDAKEPECGRIKVTIDNRAGSAKPAPDSTSPKPKSKPTGVADSTVVNKNQKKKEHVEPSASPGSTDGTAKDAQTFKKSAKKAREADPAPSSLVKRDEPKTKTASPSLHSSSTKSRKAACGSSSLPKKEHPKTQSVPSSDDSSPEKSRRAVQMTPPPDDDSLQQSDHIQMPPPSDNDISPEKPDQAALVSSSLPKNDPPKSTTSDLSLPSPPSDDTPPEKSNQVAQTPPSASSDSAPEKPDQVAPLPPPPRPPTPAPPSQLELSGVRKLKREGSIRKLMKNTVVAANKFARGPGLRSLRMLKDSKASADDSLQDANEALDVAILGPGAVIGERSIFEGHLRTTFVISNGTTKVMMIPRATYLQYVAGDAPSNEGRSWLNRAIYLEKKNANELTLDDRIYKAAMCIKASQMELAPRAFRLGGFTQKVDKYFFNSQIRHVTMFFACVLHLAMAFIEPPSTVDVANCSYPVTELQIMEGFILFIYFFEYAFIVSDIGWRRLFYANNRLLQGLILIIFFCDYGISLAQMMPRGYPRPSRFLRPIYLCLAIRFIRKVYQTALYLIPKVTEVFVILLSLCVIFGSASVYLFDRNGSKIYNKTLWEESNSTLSAEFYPQCQIRAKSSNSTAILGCPEVNSETFDSFSSISRATVAIFSLVTTESFPTITIPAYFHNHGYMLFFVIILWGGHFFVMNIFTAVLCGQYRRVSLLFLRKAVRKERDCMKHAFVCLDVWDAGVIPWQVFRELALKLNPKADMLKLRTCFRLLDKDRRGVLSFSAFIGITDVLRLHISRKKGALVGSSNFRGAEIGWIPWFADVICGISLTISKHIIWKFLWDFVIAIGCVTLLVLQVSDLLGDEERLLLGDIEKYLVLAFPVKLVIHVFGNGPMGSLTNSWVNTIVSLALLYTAL